MPSKFCRKKNDFCGIYGEVLHGLFVNPFAALAQVNVLAIVVFAMFVGVAIVVGGNRYKNILQIMQEGLELILRMVGWIMRLSPYGIAALLAKLLATQDVSLIGSLVKFIFVVLGTTLLHGFGVVGFTVFVCRSQPIPFFSRS